MKAVILAGGLGTRLHPLTMDIPKPMLPLANRPLMSYLIELLAQNGFNELSVLLYHQPEVIKDYFKNGEQFKVEIKYIEAPQDFGTAGAVKFACKNIKEPFLVISADLITDINFSALSDFHKRKRSSATIVLARVSNPLSYGIVIIDENKKVKQFLEKPSWGEVFSDTVNAGIYMLEPEVLESIPLERAFDFSLDLFPLLLREGKPIFGFVAEGYWKDIGKLEDYGKAHREVLSRKLKVKLEGEKIRDNFWAGKNVVMASSAVLENLGMVGDNSIVADQAVISDTVIGRDCKIGRGVSLRECVLWDGVEVESEAKLERVIVGDNVRIGSRATLGEGVVVGSETEIGKDAEIKPFIKIWPRRVIEEGAIVSQSLIWRERWTKSIFGQYGVTGICNLEITPQFAAALGAAYGSILGKGARISSSRDSHKASRMIYRGLISGVLSCGVNISNLEMVPIPVNRYEIASLKSKGGFHVRKSPFDPEIIDVKFFDASGKDLSPQLEKRIERRFFAEDFPRTRIDETGELAYPYHRVAEEYRDGILNVLDVQRIKNSNCRLVIDYSFGSASQIFPSILGELGLDVIALDAYIDENKITKDRATFERSLQQMTRIVKSVGADLGVMLDTGAEKVFICNEQGQVIEGTRALAIMALLTLRSKKSAAVAVPIKETRAIEEIAGRYKGKVVRTKNTFHGMMEAAAKGEVSFLGESEGGFIFPEFMPAFDGMLSVCKLVEYLCREKVKLSELEAEIPLINLMKTVLPCKAEEKGRIMRKSVEDIRDADRLESLDGLKIWHGKDWVLILPDPALPVLHLYAEAGSHKGTELLLDKYINLIGKFKEGE